MIKAVPRGRDNRLANTLCSAASIAISSDWAFSRIRSRM
jgi:hypothetical protein